MPVMHHAAPTSAFPLHWPEGYPRTSSQRRKEARFRAPLRATIQLIVDELTSMHTRNTVISTNLPTRNDGLPYASGRLQTDDPGAAVYWYHPTTRKSYVLACDCWASVGENLRAIALSLQAMRALERWGVSEIQERTFSGFQALPAATGAPHHFDGIRTRADLDTLYREKARIHHPDVGGSADAFMDLNLEYAEAARRIDPCVAEGCAYPAPSSCPSCRGRGYRS